LSEIQLQKFYNFSSSEYMVDTTLMGNWSGLGGNPALNTNNHAGYSDDILMTFNIGGAIGDSSWIDAGEVPIITMQGQADYFAPFQYGIVTVPGTTVFVIDVSGSSDISRMQEKFGNNDVFKTPAISDAYTTRANTFNTANDATYGNAGDEGLFAFEGAANGNGPWEWIDTAAVKAEATLWGQDGDVILDNFYAANPFFEYLYVTGGYAAARSRAIAYCDTIQGYLSPRLYRGLLEQPFSVAEFAATEVSVYPNPATDQIAFVSEDSKPISEILFYALDGKVVRREANINATNVVISNLDLPKGIYFANLRFKGNTTVKKIVIQ